MKNLFIEINLFYKIKEFVDKGYKLNLSFI